MQISIESQGLVWYALYTRHQHEKSVAESIRRTGVETFLPLYSCAHRWADRTKEILLPLFPRYVFVRGGVVGQDLQILRTPGVYDFVRHLGRAAPIPEVEIESVRRLLESSLRIDPHPFLKRGDWVRVKSGPLLGLEGILLRKKNLYRFVLSVDLLQKSVSVEVDATTVERTPKKEMGRPHRGARQSLQHDSGAA